MMEYIQVKQRPAANKKDQNTCYVSKLQTDIPAKARVRQEGILARFLLFC